MSSKFTAWLPEARELIDRLLGPSAADMARQKRVLEALHQPAGIGSERAAEALADAIAELIARPAASDAARPRVAAPIG